MPSLAEIRAPRLSALTWWQIATNLASMTDTSFHADTIRRLGGKAAICRALGLDASNATKWHVRGIPAHLWHRVEALAADHGEIDITAEALAGTKPRATEAA
jgi:hypothetical protein